MSHLSSSIHRRRFLAAAGAGLALGAGLPRPARAANWRGLVGSIKPLANDSSLSEIIRLLPDGIGILPVYLNMTKGTREEMEHTYGKYEQNIAYLAQQHCDLISIEGAPQFMILGLDGETRMVDGWQQKYKVPMFTSSRNQIDVLRAMKVKRIFGATVFSGKINESYAKYFNEGGIDVVAMEGMEGVSFLKIPEVPPEVSYAFIKKKFLEHKGGADAIYILGSAWDTLGIVAALEQDLGVPVVHPTAARIWEIQRRLHVHQPIKGYGMLLETLPA